MLFRSVSQSRYIHPATIKRNLRLEFEIEHLDESGRIVGEELGNPPHCASAKYFRGGFIAPMIVEFFYQQHHAFTVLVDRLADVLFGGKIVEWRGFSIVDWESIAQRKFSIA